MQEKQEIDADLWQGVVHIPSDDSYFQEFGGKRLHPLGGYGGVIEDVWSCSILRRGKQGLESQPPCECVAWMWGQGKTRGLLSLLELTKVCGLLGAVSSGRKTRAWVVHGERIKEGLIT